MAERVRSRFSFSSARARRKARSAGEVRSFRGCGLVRNSISKQLIRIVNRLNFGVASLL
jgi:hypothetical protein